jgi:hypothetical protein
MKYSLRRFFSHPRILLGRSTETHQFRKRSNIFRGSTFNPLAMAGEFHNIQAALANFDFSDEAGGFPESVSQLSLGQLGFAASRDQHSTQRAMLPAS